MWKWRRFRRNELILQSSDDKLSNLEEKLSNLETTVGDHVGEYRSDKKSVKVGVAVFGVVLVVFFGITYSQINDMVADQLKDAVKSEVEDQLEGTVKSEVEDQLEGTVKSEVEDQLEGTVKSEVEDQLEGTVKSEVEDQLEGTVKSEVEDQLEGTVKSEVEDQLEGAVLSEILKNAGTRFAEIERLEREAIESAKNAKDAEAKLETLVEHTSWSGYVKISELKGHHRECNTVHKSHQPVCIAAIHRYCKKKYQATMGMSQEQRGQEDLLIVCLR